MKKILVVDDEFLIRYTLEEGLKDRGYDAKSAGTIEEAVECVKKFHPNVVILDNLLEHSVGMDEIATFKNMDEDIQVILMTAYGSVSQAVEATKRGAYDYVLKPFDVDEIDFIIKRCLEQMKRRDSLEFLKGKSQDFTGISEAVCQIRSQIKVLGENSSVNVLIRGETGTGKEVVARQIHDCSDRRENLMVRINCGAIPENLLESELFGYVEGAFTGTSRGGKMGLFEQAHGGTLFLDEVEEISLSTQSKLLRTLQEKQVRRIGDNKVIDIDVRILSATNKSITKLSGEGGFRKDLMYRLDVLRLFLPPLRQREKDVEFLFCHLLKNLCQDMGVKTPVTEPEALELLYQYPFMGNIRELRNIAERALVLGDGSIITKMDLKRALYPRDLETGNGMEKETDREKSGNSARSSQAESVPKPEKDRILEALDQCGGNRTRAAGSLGMDRSTLWRKMKKYGL